MSTRLAFAEFAPSPWPELAWADSLTREEAAEFAVERDTCPSLLGLTGCCSAGVCDRGERLRVVTLGDCYRCLNPEG